MARAPKGMRRCNTPTTNKPAVSVAQRYHLCQWFCFRTKIHSLEEEDCILIIIYKI